MCRGDIVVVMVVVVREYGKSRLNSEGARRGGNGVWGQQGSGCTGCMCERERVRWWLLGVRG